MIAPKEREQPAPTDTFAELRGELRILYRELDEAVAMRGPVCQLSGRCCRFKEYGHSLFLSAPEAQLLLADAPQPVGQLDDGESCPWQDARGRCTAREARPLGCRVYFCDPSLDNHAPKLSEMFLARLKQLANQHDWPWNYAPLHQHLQQAQSEGHLRIASASSDIQPEGPSLVMHELASSIAPAEETRGQRARPVDDESTASPPEASRNRAQE